MKIDWASFGIGVGGALIFVIVGSVVIKYFSGQMLGERSWLHRFSMCVPGTLGCTIRNTQNNVINTQDEIKTPGYYDYDKMTYTSPVFVNENPKPKRGKKVRFNPQNTFDTTNKFENMKSLNPLNDDGLGTVWYTQGEETNIKKNAYNRSMFQQWAEDGV